jgi:hypothetical protein
MFIFTAPYETFGADPFTYGQRSLKRACMSDISDVTTTILPLQDRVVVASRRNLLSNNFQQY